MRRENRTPFDEESGSLKAKTRLLGGFFRIVVPGPGQKRRERFCTARRAARRASRRDATSESNNVR
ncbi:hypothetical protein FZI19_15335 [Cronobacter muytjensii]|uniref:Uncharacterized protein n=1 Tax=Cronobacter muytjensii TaxID=413501 RepID=A0ABQ6TX58_9ENTR|nr:hypothetical protein FZI19_15335 [Cronobacter muytjensii]